MKYDQGQAPRITRELIESQITLIEYLTPINGHPCERNLVHGRAAILADHINQAKAQIGRLTVCVIVFKSGAIVTGQSICAHLANYDEKRGKDAAYENAINNAWPLFGFHLASMLGDVAAYVDKDGVTRDADGEESFMQFSYSHEGKKNLLDWLGSTTREVNVNDPASMGRDVNLHVHGEVKVIDHDDGPIQGARPVMPPYPDTTGAEWPGVTGSQPVTGVIGQEKQADKLNGECGMPEGTYGTGHD